MVSGEEGSVYSIVVRFGVGSVDGFSKVLRILSLAWGRVCGRKKMVVL